MEYNSKKITKKFQNTQKFKITIVLKIQKCLKNIINSTMLQNRKLPTSMNKLAPLVRASNSKCNNNNWRASGSDRERTIAIFKLLGEQSLSC